jgi:general secretion pathway protein I
LPKSNRKRQRVREHTAGFTLIEVVVALAIAALGLGFLVAAAGTGLENATLADRYIELTRLAQSHLAAVDVVTPLRPGEQGGDDGGGYSWRVRVSQPVVHAAAPASEMQLSLALYSVEVTETWRSGLFSKSVSLQSQHVGRAERPGNG